MIAASQTAPDKPWLKFSLTDFFTSDLRVWVQAALVPKGHSHYVLGELTNALPMGVTDRRYYRFSRRLESSQSYIVQPLELAC
jgi:hypothetical protein